MASIEQERKYLSQAESAGVFPRLRAYISLSGPGWLQSAITLGGGSLASSLFLGVLAGYSLLWLQPLAIVLGIVMLSAISHVTLSTGQSPFVSINNEINPNKWSNYSDEEIISELVKIKGVGRWTAEMFLIFNLCRPDIFPVDDLGLIKGICNCYNMKYPITKDHAIKMSEKWKPYRSVATWYFWRSLDPIPVEY